MSDMNLFVPIRKVDAAQRLVYGVIADETPDKSGEVFDYETSAPNFKAWSAEFEKVTEGKSKGNVRAMHGKVAAGKLTDIAFDDAAKSVSVCAHIVDDAEWAKVEGGVYTGFSIGGSYVKRWNDPANPVLKRYTALPSEVSVVDNPCNAGATFSMVKADGMVEDRPFKTVETPNKPGGELEQVWKAADGATFKLKADAVAHNEALAKVSTEGDPGDGVNEPAPGETPAAPIEPAPAPEVGKGAPAPLAKGMYGVSDLAQVLVSLRWIAEDSFYEAQSEGDGSTVPAALRAWLAQGATIFIQMATEEARELIGAADGDEITFDMVLELAAKAEGLAKAGKGSAQVIHDHAAKMGAKCAGAAKSAGGDDLAKMTTDLAASSEALAKAAGDLEKVASERDELRGELDALIKSLPAKYGEIGGTLVGVVEKMTARLEELEKQPTTGGPLFTISKVEDGGESATETSPEAVAAALAKMTPEEQTKALIKAAYRNPISI